MPSKTQQLPLYKKIIIHLVAWGKRTLHVRRGESFLGRIYPSTLRHEDPIMTTIRYHKQFTLKLNTRSWLEWRLFIDGYYEPNIVHTLLEYIRAGDVVVDIGANIGVHTLIMSDVVQHGHVYAFEPMPVVRQKLENNLKMNDVHNVTVYPNALGNETGQAKLYFDAQDTNEGLATLYGNASGLQETLVDVCRLDDVLAMVDTVRLIKIDIQGAEFPAILGAEQLIRRCRPYVIFEYDESWHTTPYHFSDVVAFFESLGYCFYAIHESGQRERTSIPLPFATEYLASPER